MGTFDSFHDMPEQIKLEGQSITIKFDRTGPTTGRVSWTLPDAVAGCSTPIDEMAYCGIIVTLDTSAGTIKKIPQDGLQYTADPTGDKNLHAGDTIDTALVIGSFYHDRTTTFFDITGLIETEAYYVSGFAVDCQNRYHSEGVHAYSLDLTNTNGTPDTPASQLIEFDNPFALTDPSGLTPGQTYTFEIAIDDPGANSDLIPKPDPITKTITIDGSDAATYQDLIDVINLQLAQLDNPFSGPTPPGTGGFYWNPTTKELFQWDGFTHNKQDVIVESTDPTVIGTGEYWYNPTTDVLSQWDGAAWIVEPVLKYKTDPTQPICETIWFDGTNIRLWDGTVWCLKNIFLQPLNPSLPVDQQCGTYWYDSTNLILNKWDDISNVWVPANPVLSTIDPNSLPATTYWVNDSTQELFQWSGVIFNPLIFTFSVTEPLLPAALDYWFDSTNQILFQRDIPGLNWVQVPEQVIIFDTDPTIRNSCDIWWNTTLDTLNIWDDLNSTWDLVTNFLQQAIDPTFPPTLTLNDYWYDGTVLYQWDGGAFVVVSDYISWPSEPNLLTTGDVWFNTTDNIWNEWTGTAFIIFDPIDSINDPTASLLPAGTFWFDTTNDTLHQWNGVSFVNLSYSTAPLNPTKGTLWYDTTTNTLKEWSRDDTWVPSDLPGVFEYVEPKSLQVNGSTLGCTANILIPIDGTPNIFSFLDIYSSTTIFYEPTDGADGVSDIPLYAQIGVGDDGSPDERRELADSIRAQLGYPVVEIELTKQQMDYAIDSGIEELRKRTSSAYKRGFFFLDTRPGQQQYLLTNKCAGFNKIVQVMNIYRTSGPFGLGGQQSDNSVFDTANSQYLYNNGTYDLISFHLVSSYIEDLEDMFAYDIQFQFNEQTRALDLLQSIFNRERIVLDVSVERTEQDMISDRYLKTWIENYAMASSMVTLSQIRGKYATLPGAGGGVSLNGSDLYQAAQDLFADLYQQIDDYLVQSPEEFGAESGMIIG